jgi:2-keto-4-pentenoate hydratase/2-oxohepta-3-ene-1,7-dioic acid hydratase in catechol pathway
VSYQHVIDDQKMALSVGKVVCVGRNYIAHVRELNNQLPDDPVLFLKPYSAMVSMREPIRIPVEHGDCHFETELAILIGRRLTKGCDEIQAMEAILGVGLALDLTLRDLQLQLKKNGLPWDKAKAFDGSCPLSDFISVGMVGDLQQQHLRLWRNGQLQQQGFTGDMLIPVPSLMVYATQFFSLQPGDVLITGTPAGVGPLNSGDHLKLSLSELIEIDVPVI